MNNSKRLVFTAISLIMFSSLSEGSNSDMSRTFPGDTQDFSAQPQAQTLVQNSTSSGVIPFFRTTPSTADQRVHQVGERPTVVLQRGSQMISCVNSKVGGGVRFVLRKADQVIELVRKGVVSIFQRGGRVISCVTNKFGGVVSKAGQASSQLGRGVSRITRATMGWWEKTVTQIIKILTAAKSGLITEKVQSDLNAKVKGVNEGSLPRELFEEVIFLVGEINRLQETRQQETECYEYSVNLQSNFQAQSEVYSFLEYLLLKLARMLPFTEGDDTKINLEKVIVVIYKLESLFHELIEELLEISAREESNSEVLKKFLVAIETLGSSGLSSEFSSHSLTSDYSLMHLSPIVGILRSFGSIAERFLETIDRIIAFRVNDFFWDEVVSSTEQENENYSEEEDEEEWEWEEEEEELIFEEVEVETNLVRKKKVIRGPNDILKGS